MRLNGSLMLALLAFTGVSRAGPTPQEFALLFGHRIQLACIAQDPAYRRSAFGRSFAAGPTFQGWSVLEEQPFSRCLNQRKFLDQSLCDDVTTIDIYADVPGQVTVAAMASALHRHEAALAAADDTLYLEDDAWKAPARFVCPATVPHHSKTSP
jgi:hypothetical protein